MRKRPYKPARRARHYRPPKKNRMCDPGVCNHCIYIGEGDFICDRYHDEKGNPAILVVSDWQPTENNLKCRLGGTKDAARG